MKRRESLSQRSPYAPSFVNARREAWLILSAWAVCLLWTVGYSALAGYDVPPEQISFILGMPDWIFWGVLMPWIAATLFSVWFGLVYMTEDDLGPAEDDEEPHA